MSTSVGPSLAIPSPKLTPAIDLQAQVDFPGYSNAIASSTQTPSLGDGTVDFTGGLFLNLPFYAAKTYLLSAILGGGYTYRSQGYSSALPWSAILMYAPYREGFFVSLGSLGMVSLLTDPNAVIGRSSAGSGGSYITGDVNPTLVQFRGQAGYKPSWKTEISVSVTQSIWGQDAPNGLNVVLGFQAHIGHDKTLSPAELSPESYGESNKGFLSYSMEAKVLKSNDRMNLVKIDKGSQDGVEVGQIFDIFRLNNDGSPGSAIARGKVSSVKANESALEVEEYYKQTWIEEGFTARRLIE